MKFSPLNWVFFIDFSHGLCNYRACAIRVVNWSKKDTKNSRSRLVLVIHTDILQPKDCVTIITLDILFIPK